MNIDLTECTFSELYGMKFAFEYVKGVIKEHPRMFENMLIPELGFSLHDVSEILLAIDLELIRRS